MEIIRMKNEYMDVVTEIAYGTYLTEYHHFQGIPVYSKESLRKHMKDTITDMQGYVYKEQGEVFGFLLCYVDKRDANMISCWMPLWGYGAIGDRREKILSRLFQRIAEDLCKEKKVRFEFKLYAHDETVIKLFSFLQFGIECEEGICSTEEKIRSESSIQIRELSKTEVKQRWSEIWQAMSCLIHHLQVSPVFSPCTNFTEELYHTFFMDPDTSVYVAEKERKVIGLIETNKEKREFVGENEACYNTGEVFVTEEYRGRGVAQALLQYVKETKRSQGIQYLWVEHGTANPNARGFWNKYFETYCYTMIRDININE